MPFAQQARVAAALVSLLAGAASASGPYGASDSEVKLHAASGTPSVINASDGVKYGTIEWEPEERFSFSSDVQIDGTMTIGNEIRGSEYERTVGAIELMAECNAKGMISDGKTCHLVTSRHHNLKFKDLVSSLSYFMCAIMTDDSVRCWGHNPYSMCGLGSDNTYRYLPWESSFSYDKRVLDKRLYNGRTRMLPFVMSYQSTGIVDSNGRVWVTGYGGNGLGLGSTSSFYHFMPVPEQYLANITSLAIGGDNSNIVWCAISGDETLYCWGYNGYGQVGVGDYSSPKKVPQRVLGLNGVKMVSIVRHHQGHTCATLNDHSVWCWGYNGYGQLGSGDNSNQDSPGRVSCNANCGSSSFVTNVEYVKVHGSNVGSSYAVKYDGTLWSWGYSGHGQLGYGSTSNRNRAVEVVDSNTGKALADVRDVYPSNGDRYAPICAVTKAEGMLYCWGYNNRGQLGVGDTSSRNKATLVRQIKGVKHFENPQTHDHSYQYRPGGCSLLFNGEIWCQGYNGNGVLGQGDQTQQTTPVKVKFIGTASKLNSRCYGGSGNDCTFYAMSDSGYNLWAWGYGGHGQTGVRMGSVPWNPIAVRTRQY